MAHSWMSATITLIVLVISCTVFRTKAQINTACSTSMISSFTPCLNFITGSSGSGSSPTRDCCDTVKSLMTDNMDCACLIITGSVPVSIPFINANMSISLPRACKSSVPLQCKASGVPLPPPGPVLFAPPPAPVPTYPLAPVPAHTHAPPPHSPKDSKAAGVAAPPPSESLDIAPTPPPKFSLGPSANPGIRPVVNLPNSAITLMPFNLLMFLGIINALNIF
ncbi:hypothetical protein ACS0TY_012921 [Phlomoides rotata]